MLETREIRERDAKTRNAAPRRATSRRFWRVKQTALEASPSPPLHSRLICRARRPRDGSALGRVML